MAKLLKKDGTLSEFAECKKFCEYALYHPLLRDYLIHIPNEGQRHIAHLRNLAQIGLKAGVPDYFLPLKNDYYIGLWLEMKAVSERNVKKRSNQDQWIKKLLLAGHYATYAYGADDAIDIVTKYLNNESLG